MTGEAERGASSSCEAVHDLQGARHSGASRLQWPPIHDTPEPSDWTHVPTGLADARLLAAIPEILAMIAELLPDRAAHSEVMPLITDAVRVWSQRQLRQGTPVPDAGAIEALAQAVYDQRYGLGPLAAYLRDPDVENVDVNGCNEVWISYNTGERVAAAPVAASDEALADMIRAWAARGGQTARDFSAASPLVNVALAGGARMTATMSVTPRPCLSLRRHGQLDVTLAELIQLGCWDGGCRLGSALSGLAHDESLEILVAVPVGPAGGTGAGRGA